MTKINILSPLLADMIAAGEVVERPASVIKELMENSFDAGAKKVTVEFKNGGAPYIRVSDDGCGMSPEDAGIAFTRHATSKLSDEKGLEAIGTMGFRGEALAAIAAVSKTELVTRERESDEGVCVTVQAGDIIDMVPCGCPAGTVITIRDIFYNTPARLKFLKSDRSEASACIGAALRCALGRPEVSVRLIRDGEEVFFTPGDGRPDSVVYSLLGRELAGTLLPCKGENGGISVNGFLSSPSAGRGNRAQQYFFCNGRAIKSPLLQTAVEQAYKNSLLTGRFPACVIYLDLSCGAVDVNVHPAKTEVRFSDEKRIFDTVYQTCRAALEGETRPAEIRISEGTRRAISKPDPDFFRTMPSSEYRESTAPSSRPTQIPDRYTFSEPAPAPYTAAPLPRQTSPASFASSARKAGKPIENTGDFVEKVEKAVENVEKSVASAYRVIGEALNTYILVECGDELILIDKHAAHERMIFDRLKAQKREISSQLLLEGILIHPSPADTELLLNDSALLSELGFELEPFGERALMLRSLPDDIDPGEAVPAVEEICEKLRRGTADPAGARDEILHTVACKAAIKAGRRHEPEELERIAAAVMAGEVRYCPHGRPVSVRMTKKELDKSFSRIV